MRILIVTPAPVGSTTGNRITAERWSEFMQQLGHEVIVADDCAGAMAAEGNFDCLITLHATRSRSSITAFRQQSPGRPVALCMTGTDLHLDLAGQRGDVAKQHANESVSFADRIVLLEPACAAMLPADSRDKVVVIRQSASPVEIQLRTDDRFRVCVVGHLRAEKDPFLAAEAARLLPAESNVMIHQYGAALSDEMQACALKEISTNPRYHWHGEVPHAAAVLALASSDLMALTSRIEGAPSVISEAIVNRVPIVATRIPATIGLLGNDYPGLFSVGDAESLMQQMLRAERDAGYLAQLRDAIGTLRPQFLAQAEVQAIADLLNSML